MVLMFVNIDVFFKHLFSQFPRCKKNQKWLALVMYWWERWLEHQWFGRCSEQRKLWGPGRGRGGEAEGASSGRDQGPQLTSLWL